MAGLKTKQKSMRLFSLRTKWVGLPSRSKGNDRRESRMLEYLSRRQLNKTVVVEVVVVVVSSGSIYSRTELGEAQENICHVGGSVVNASISCNPIQSNSAGSLRSHSNCRIHLRLKPTTTTTTNVYTAAHRIYNSVHVNKASICWLLI
jgi:hypothetical protein